MEDELPPQLTRIGTGLPQRLPCGAEHADSSARICVGHPVAFKIVDQQGPPLTIEIPAEIAYSTTRRPRPRPARTAYIVYFIYII